MSKYYTYYSYEEAERGRGYIGYRKCPEDISIRQDKYLGSFTDKSFKPTCKVIIGIYDTQEDAVKAEADLHELYNVDSDPHFANKIKQSKYWYYDNRGISLSEAHKKKLSKSLKGRPSPNKGNVYSAETREKFSIRMKNAIKTNPEKYTYLLSKKCPSAETRAKLSVALSGTKNPSYKGIRYSWYNKKTGETEVDKTILEMKEKYKYITNKIYYVATKKVKSHKGWVII